jgi:2-polyprenyl-3-methyl-5-hydroxy-6-metoxy-1,4-benzoquinol methylase
MSAMAPDPDTSLQYSELRKFKQFIYDNYHAGHRVFGDETEGSWDKRFYGHQSVMRLMLPPNKAAPILDFGCGDGLLLAVAQSLGYSDLAGVDLSEALLEKAARHTSAKLKHGDGLEYLKSCSDGVFEGVIAFDIFEHLSRPELLEICREFARTLKPGGRLIVRVPNGLSPICGHLLWSDITHERPFTEGSLTQLLRPFGFVDIKAIELAPVVVHGLKSGIHAALWYIFRAVTALRIALETGQLRGYVLTRNLHLIACKGSG